MITEADQRRERNSVRHFAQLPGRRTLMRGRIGGGIGILGGNDVDVV
jgi:hypothetical protein